MYCVATEGWWLKSSSEKHMQRFSQKADAYSLEQIILSLVVDCVNN